MIHLLKEVARGKRGARDLTYEESLAAAEAIMTLRGTPAQIGAFLIAERIKLESVEELEAFVAVCRQYAHRTPVPDGIDCAGPYDGRKSSFMATFATSFLLASAGLPTTLHGTASLPPKWGVTLHDMLREAGIDAERLSREQSLHAARETGVLYVPAEQWCSPLKELRPIREELGMRTVLNTAEKLIDYTHSPYLVYGVYHNTVFDRLARLLVKLGYRKALIVQGPEGSEELFIDRPTRTYRVENGEFRLQMFDPETLGLDTPLPQIEWTADEQLRVSESVMRGEADLAFYNLVLLNGAVRLHLAERVGSVEEGLYTCKSLLDNGQAWSVYARWRKALST
ncbi:anthranilate phosphoribosyltransferase [Paenibacillus mesophilus]|uniref:anthranilate phosphoribosyltransferase n=1 Tax=Paenibacillus mesophilus TaxID=2582849 RepID=UPI00110D284B|nr:anthranilate phosphoribosyltransferase [Paenibacillus mesophilus]TMV50843.1 anthranilate phosphoribosyltransferase [Paenibacillus mesophilus]